MSNLYPHCSPEQVRTRISLFGVPIDIIDDSKFDAALATLMLEKGPHQIVFLRTIDVLRARRNPHFARHLREAALIVPVSMGLKKAVRQLDLGELVRYSPFELVIRLFNILESIHGTYFVLGDKQPYLSYLESNLRQTFPGARPLGRYTGKYLPVMEKDILQAIHKAEPNLLFCGPGLRGRDSWIATRKHGLPRGVQLWCGECFEYLTGRRQRPNRAAFRKGREFYRESIHRIWRVLRVPFYAYFKLLVLVSRLTKTRR